LEQRLHELESRMAGSLTSTQPTECPSDDTTQHEVKAVSGASDLPIGDGEWDASAARKRIFEWAGDEMSKAKRAFFWVEGDPNNKGSYKLPFADVRDNKLIAIKAALSAVQGALNGARGGIDGLSDADKEAIMAKVNAYKKRAGEEPKFDADAINVLNDFKKYLRGDK
jgi:hypothetical protein